MASFIVDGAAELHIVIVRLTYSRQAEFTLVLVQSVCPCVCLSVGPCLSAFLVMCSSFFIPQAVLMLLIAYIGQEDIHRKGT